MSSEAAETGKEGGETPPKKGLNLVFLIALLNTLAVLGVGAFFYYSRFVFHRPTITEKQERAKLEAKLATPTPPTNPAFLAFGPLTVNILTESPDSGHSPKAGNVERHKYANFSLSLELRDENQKDWVEGARPFILDKILTLIAKRQAHELTSIQGRYVLQSQLIDSINLLLKNHAPPGAPEGIVTHIYFTNLVIQ